MNWEEALVVRTTKKGETIVLPVVANAVTIMANDEAWAGVLAFNSFRSSIVTLRPPPWDRSDAPQDQAIGEWTDADTVRACAWLQRHYSVPFAVSAVEQAISVVGARVVVHPVKDWLTTLEWDRASRADYLFPTYFGAEDNAYNRGVSARFMIGAVARVFEPGAKVDCTPVLEGAQGIGKSTGVRVLASDAWFFDTPIAMGDRDGYQALRGKWIGELGELHALNRADLNKAKNFLTATVDSYRPSYGRRTLDFPRQCIFVGTTNASEYLRDETGNRRFWPIKCTKVDLVGLARDRDQLWAEAYERYADCERWHVDTRDFQAACEAEQDARFVADAWEATVETWLMLPSHAERRAAGVTTGDVLAGALSMPAEKWTKADQDRVAAVLRRLGWERGRQARGPDGRRERRWQPTAAKLVTPGDRPGDELVTREFPSKTLLSPVSPVIPYLGVERENFSKGSGEPVVTLVTGDSEGSETFADWVEAQGIR